MLVVNPNPCFDRTLWVDTLAVGTVSRPHRVQVTAGGKGVNVVRALRDLGVDGTLLGLLPADGAERFEALLRDEGLTLVGVAVAGGVRSATIVVEDSGRATVLNEPGPTLGADDGDRLVTAVKSQLGNEHGTTHRAFVCSGSLPPGLPSDTYGRLVAVARAQSVASVVDGARDALAAALPARPDLVTPNVDEAEGLVTGRTVEDVAAAADEHEMPERARSAAGMLLERGARRALVTAGEHGAAYADGAGLDWIAAPAAQLANPIGAGDALVGGILAALAQAERPPSVADWAAAVRHGIAVASAAVEHPVAGRIAPERARALSARLEAAAR